MTTRMTTPKAQPTYTTYIMDHAYVMETHYRCQECGEVKNTVLSGKAFVACVRGERGEDKISLPLDVVYHRYARNYSVSIEEAKTFLPELPFLIHKYEIPIRWCRDCMPVTVGNCESDEGVKSYYLPAEKPLELGSILSENPTVNGMRGNGGNGGKKKKKGRWKGTRNGESSKESLLRILEDL